MITPRQTRLLRTPDLRSFQRAILRSALHADVLRTRATVVLVPSRAAAAELARTCEDERFAGAAWNTPASVALPDILTREEWYDRLHAGLAAPPRRLTPYEREALMSAAAGQTVAGGLAPPFAVRPALVAEMVRLYDALHRRDQSLDRFEALLLDELEDAADTDRGAARMLQQTRFLVATFRAYEARLVAAGGLDEHALRRLLIDEPPTQPVSHVVVTVADRAADDHGLWTADFDLLARLPRLDSIDVVATEALLATGFLERIRAVLPGVEEVAAEEVAANEDAARARPVLLAPKDDAAPVYHLQRDREEELAAIARRLKADRRVRKAHAPPLDRVAVVFRRPLPYLYLARDVLGAAGIPFQAADALPLAAEPFVAAIDLALACASSDFTRRTLVELLRSPHFGFDGPRGPLTRAQVAALDADLCEAGYLGGLDALARAAETNALAGRALAVARELAPLAAPRDLSAQLDTLLAFVAAHERVPALDDPLGERHRRARAATLGMLTGVRDAHRIFGDRSCAAGEVAATIRRWIEAETFSPRTGDAGVRLVDSAAARYGDFDEVSLVGLVQADWPAAASRGVFYPPQLLKALGWPDESDRAGAERAAFLDLLALARARTIVSTFTLDDDAIVEPSPFLEDVATAGLLVERSDAGRRARIFRHEALSMDPIRLDALSGEAAAWAALRAGRTSGADLRFHGAARPSAQVSYAVGALERYLDCPFKFFASKVLSLEEELEDEPVMSIRTRGIFVHEIFRAFFQEWARHGFSGIGVDDIERAREVFGTVLEPFLARLPPAEASLERTRFLGSPAAMGLAEAVFRLEAERPDPIVERLLEHELSGGFLIEHGDRARVVPLTGKADRIDVLAGNRLRIVDYKTGRAPKPKAALQLPIYSLCAAQQFARAHGGNWSIAEAAYIAFAEPRPLKPMVARDKEEALVDALTDAQGRMLDTIEGIERGEFFVRPREEFRCRFCAYPGVCRKDYVGDE